MNHHKNKRSINDDIIHAVIFVFVMLAMGELLAPYFHVKFDDPLMLAGFVTSILGYLIRPKEKLHLLVVKEGDMAEVVSKLSGTHAAVGGITVADSADHAVALLKNPAKDDGVLLKIKNAVAPKQP